MSEELQNEYIELYSYIKAEVESNEEYMGLLEEMISTFETIVELISVEEDKYTSDSNEDTLYSYTLYYDMMGIPTVHARGYYTMNGIDYSDGSSIEDVDIDALLEEYNPKLDLLLEEFFLNYLIYE